MSIDWTALTDPAFQAQAGPFEPLWLAVCHDFRGATHLRVTAGGEWSSPAPTVWGPDGDLASLGGGATLILAGAPLGALIGKVGGSSASLGPAPPPPTASQPPAPTLGQDQAFLIGGTCVFALPVGARGPLFIGFNTIRRPLDIRTLTVLVEGATF
jgi:hypothetical protein